MFQQSFVIAILGGKGGVGKSVFATNLACAMKIETKSSVLLMDLDKQSACDLTFLLGARPKKKLDELLQWTGPLDEKRLKTFIYEHSTGLNYLPLILNPEEETQVESQLLVNKLKSLKSYYEYIIVDIGHELGEAQKTLLNEATIGLVVSHPDSLCLHQTRKKMNDLSYFMFANDMFFLVLNKYSQRDLTQEQFSQTLKRPVLASLPQDDIITSQAIKTSTPFVLQRQAVALIGAYHQVVRHLTSGILQKLEQREKKKPLSVSQKSESIDFLKNLKIMIHKELIREIDLRKDLTNTKGDPKKEKELEQKTQRAISQIVTKQAPQLSRSERTLVIRQVLDEALGLGALEELLSDPTVTEIMVNSCDKVFVEKKGKLILTKMNFTSNLQLRNIIERIVTPLGRRIDEKTPYVDARLSDGSRVNAIIEPLSIDGPSITIRKFAKETVTSDKYLNWNTLTKPMLDFLRICVEQGLNIIISGGTGSGKTTLLNLLSSYIPANERIVTVEDAAELQLAQGHVVRLETRPANMEDAGAVTIRDLVKNSLRMRPDRIIVGECRDGAALDMLSAMNTGHDGSMTTVHANSPREATSRLENLSMMAGLELPVKAIREQIGSAVQLIVQISRLSDGSRKITNITEVAGIQSNVLTLQEVFRFKEEGFDKNRKILGQFQATGAIPTFIEKFENRGIHIPRYLFTGEKVEEVKRPSKTLSLRKGLKLRRNTEHTSSMKKTVVERK